jgi:hypothetical protein
MIYEIAEAANSRIQVGCSWPSKHTFADGNGSFE